MRELLAISLGLSLGVVALLLTACILPTWTTFIYRPDDLLPAGFAEATGASGSTSGQLEATFGIWTGCYTASWFQADVNETFQQQQQQPFRQWAFTELLSSFGGAASSSSAASTMNCMTLADFNDVMLAAERQRFPNAIGPLTPNFTAMNIWPDPYNTSLTSAASYYQTTNRPIVYPTAFVVTSATSTTPAPQPPITSCPIPWDAFGASYTIDMPQFAFNVFARSTYTCENGDYNRATRDILLETLCGPSVDTNETWTPNRPPCVIQDNCLPYDVGMDLWDVCYMGRAWAVDSVVNAVNNLNFTATSTLPITAYPSDTIAGTGTWLFPDFTFSCDGIIRQWDVYSNVSGSYYLTVWTMTGGKAYLVGANKFVSDGSGLQGRFVDVANRIAVRRGDFFGIVYDQLFYANYANATPPIAIYNSTDIAEANPFLDDGLNYGYLQTSTSAIQLNWTMTDISNAGNVIVNVFGAAGNNGTSNSRGDKAAAALTWSRIPDPVVPIVSAFVTAAILSPIKFERPQALIIIAILIEFVAIGVLIFYIVQEIQSGRLSLLRRRKSSQVGDAIATTEQQLAGDYVTIRTPRLTVDATATATAIMNNNNNNNNNGNKKGMRFAEPIPTGLVLVCVLLNLACALIIANALSLFLNEYNCNAATIPMSIGTGAWLAIVGAAMACLVSLLLCFADRRAKALPDLAAYEQVQRAKLAAAFAAARLHSDDDDEDDDDNKR